MNQPERRTLPPLNEVILYALCAQTPGAKWNGNHEHDEDDSLQPRVEDGDGDSISLQHVRIYLRLCMASQRRSTTP